MNNFTQSLNLQGIESHAFSYLLEELLTRCHADNETTKSLRALQAECAHTTIANRPLFNVIEDKLSALKQAHFKQSTTNA